MNEVIIDRNEKQIRAFRFDIDSTNDTGIFEGYASMFGELVPSYSEIVDKGAFTQTLKHNKGCVPVMYMHWDWIGMGLEARQDDKGLFVKAKLETENSPKARETWGLMRLAQEVKRPAGLSIGFNIVKYKAKADEPIHITEIQLIEYSPTPPGFQAAPNASTTDVRSAHVNAALALLREAGYNTNAVRKDVPRFRGLRRRPAEE